MLSDKEQKKKFKEIAQKNPNSYYPVHTLKDLGFERKQCEKCKNYFWTVNQEQNVCGDSSCSGGYRFINDSPVKNHLSYIEVWQKFSKMFKKFGYTPIKRYPVVARWNPTMEYTIASIAAFQPYVVSGEVKPPANPLVIPQFCLRFSDIDNVGVTGSHYTGFVMIGQHAFMTPEDYDTNKYLFQIYSWLKDGLGLPNEEITFHEDAWAGGGNFGPSLEFFSRGLELGNQVYMQYEQTPTGYNELNIKVLDMGMGHERNAWFASGQPTSYESTFPTVMKKLYKLTSIEPDKELMKRFLPYASYLNVDETNNIDKEWKRVARLINVDIDKLKTQIALQSALYSIADHTRTLMFAITDGALPSNVGGAYNLRVILRRVFSFIDKYNWHNIDLIDVCKEHADYLKPIFPKLNKNFDEIKEIFEVEKAKYENTKQKSKAILKRIIKTDINKDKLIELYDSNGISPEIVKEEAKALGKEVKIPDNFYALVAERHDKKQQAHETNKKINIDIQDLPETDILYYDDYENVEFEAKVLRVEDKFVVLNKTAFYPTSGGQMHDVGTIQGANVVDVIKQGKIILHVMEDEFDKSVEGETVKCKINKERRKQLAQHHTATHIINAAARRVLGKHINQAGAKKTIEKAHIDLTHYKSISSEELKMIEDEANKIVNESIPVRSLIKERNLVEQMYGMNIYQGGAVPGKKLRIVEIPEVDVECCGGTHVHNTKEVGSIKIIKSTKISDGIVRLIFVAGNAAKKESNIEHSILEQTAKILNVKNNEVPARAEELFKKWKKAKKAIKKGKKVNSEDFILKENVPEKLSDEELLKKTAEVFKTQPEHVPKTAKRFMDELNEMMKNDIFIN
ncbi:alanine--tRNA ligase [Candidatus Woesearchaeota archaeon]|nr:MAG: alanine--tRNA ligase [Candidatus Woesearchaeota archaeon]